MTQAGKLVKIADKTANLRDIASPPPADWTRARRSEYSQWAKRVVDNLEGFWKGQFGHTHGLMVVNAFYEHVALPTADGTPDKVILEFKSCPTQEMLVACIWSHWTGPGESDLLSFAAITDEPPPEVAAARHDRCIIPIKPENIDAWLNPNPRDRKALYAILDDRERPYFEHRLAA